MEYNGITITITKLKIYYLLICSVIEISAYVLLIHLVLLESKDDNLITISTGLSNSEKVTLYYTSVIYALVMITPVFRIIEIN